MKIFQIVNGKCHWQTPFESLDETTNFPPDCIFVEAPDYVNEQWGFDETEIGDDRFIAPTPQEGFVYDEDSGQLVEESTLATMLTEAQDNKQNENNEALAKYLSEHPLTWTDGKQYGVTKEDQNEIMANLVSYQNDLALGVKNPRLEWHAIHEACVPWTYEALATLSSAIRDYVYPFYNLNQSYKEKIYACTKVSEVNDIQLDYPAKTEEISAEQTTESTTEVTAE